MRERWFNYRPICLTFAFLLLGSLFAFYVESFLVLCLAISIVVFVLLLLLAIFKKKPKYVIVPMVVFLIGAGAYNLALLSFNNQQTEKPGLVSARIYQIDRPTDGRITIQADSVKFDDKNEKTNIIVYVYDYDGLFEGVEIGAKIRFSPLKFYNNDLFDRKTPNAKMYANNIKYSMTTNISAIEFDGVDKTFAEMIKGKIKDNISLGLTNENTELVYSSLFGEKNMLMDSQYDSYRLSGVAHLLAVSGLHVGIIVAILLFILKKCRIKGWIQFGIVATFLLCYLALCNFTISAIRASIMALVLMLANLLHRDYDNYNAISLAGIVVFLINPLSVFDISFLMSFSCAFGIALFYKPFRKGLLAMRCTKAIAESLAMSLATTLILVFIMAYYFQTLNVISIFANIIIIPIFTIGFVIAFIVALLSLIIPIVGYILYPVNFIFDFIALLSTILGNLPIANFSTITFHFIVIAIYFIFLLVCSRLCTAKYQYKIMATLPIVALIFCCLLY
ncbi:MAG: ComEC/Rec2 family competence protein [Clostridia bacterium]|nr:ComEC/Rec2 family competence protein [Clostridia bacterium]